MVGGKGIMEIAGFGFLSKFTATPGQLSGLMGRILFRPLGRGVCVPLVLELMIGVCVDRERLPGARGLRLFGSFGGDSSSEMIMVVDRSSGAVCVLDSVLTESVAVSALTDSVVVDSSTSMGVGRRLRDSRRFWVLLLSPCSYNRSKSLRSSRLLWCRQLYWECVGVISSQQPLQRLALGNGALLG